MSFGQETKNGSAPLGSIKDRIKSFEFMKDNRPVSPNRARSPISAWNGETPRTIQRTINMENDSAERSNEQNGERITEKPPERTTERRQMRRSERREAVLRQRESQLLAAKNDKQTEVDTSDENTLGSGRQPVTRLNDRRLPRVAPRIKEKPPEPAPRKRIQDYKESGVTVSKTQEPVVERKVYPTLENLASPRTTESSSNETIDLNTSDDPSDGSSEDILEKEDRVKNKKKESRMNEQIEVERAPNRRYKKQNEPEEEKVEEWKKEDKEENGGKYDIEENEHESEENQEENQEDDGEEEYGEEDEKSEEEEEIEDEMEEVSDEEVDENQAIDEDFEEDRDVEEEIEEEDSENEEEDVEDEGADVDREEEKRLIEERMRHEERERREEREKRKEKEKRKDQIKRGKLDQERKEIDKDGEENEDYRQMNHKRKGSKSGETNENKKGGKESREQIRRNSRKLLTKNNAAENNERENLTEKDQNVPIEKVKVKPKKIEDQLPENKSRTTKKAARRTLSKNSLKLGNDDVFEESKQLSGKSTEGKTGQATKMEENLDGNPTNKVKRTPSYVGDERSQGMNENENVPPSPTQCNLFSNKVLEMVPGNKQKSHIGEDEGLSSTGDNHDDGPGKKAFVCAIHEEPCKYYCQDCERLICSECAMRWGDCHEHYYMRVKDAWKKYREEMMKILQDARSNVSRIQDEILENSKSRDSFKLKVDSTLKKINSFFDEHVQALEKRRTFFLENVEEIMKFREIGINQEIDSLQNNLLETSGTINIAGRVYGTSTMMEFLQVCKQLSNHLLELGQKKCKTHLTDNVDIDFFSEPNLFEDIERLGQLKKHRLSLANVLEQSEDVLGYDEANMPKRREEQDEREKIDNDRKEEESSLKENIIETNTSQKKLEQIGGQDSIETSIGTSTENLSESTSTKDTNDHPTVKQPTLPSSDDVHHQPVLGVQEIRSEGVIKKEILNDSECLNNENGEKEKIEIVNDEEVYKRGQETIIEEDNQENSLTNHTPAIEDFNAVKETETCFCNNVLNDIVNYPNDFPTDHVVPKNENLSEKGESEHYPRRHSMDDTLGRRSKKEEIQRRLGNMGKLRSHKGAAQFMDEGERYFSSGEAEQRRRKQEYYKVRFNDRAYYSNPSDSSELEDMRRYDFEENNRPIKQRVRRHRTLPLIRPISERQRDKIPWFLDVIRFHGKIHFSRSSLKATGKAFGWNAVVGSQGFSKGKHTWKVRVTKWTAVGVCYKDDHMDNPSWGAGNKWTWDSADMCYSPRHGVCESPVGEWIDGDIIALELDCDNSVLIVHNLRTLESDRLFGFKEPVYPYFYLSVFRSVSLIEIDGVQVG